MVTAGCRRTGSRTGHAGAMFRAIGRSRVGLGPPHLFSANKMVGQGPPYEGAESSLTVRRRWAKAHPTNRSRSISAHVAIVEYWRLTKRNGPPGGAGRWGRDGASGERRGESRHRAARIRATTLHKPDDCVTVACKRVKIRVRRCLRSVFTQQETSPARACRDRSRRCRYPATHGGRERFRRRSPAPGRNRRRWFRVFDRTVP